MQAVVTQAAVVLVAATRAAMRIPAVEWEDDGSPMAALPTKAMAMTP